MLGDRSGQIFVVQRNEFLRLVYINRGRSNLACGDGFQEGLGPGGSLSEQLNRARLHLWLQSGVGHQNYGSHLRIFKTAQRGENLAAEFGMEAVNVADDPSVKLNA